MRAKGCLLFFSILFFSSGLYLSAQFTEKRIKRGPSMGNLKESCCKGCGEILQGTAELLSSLGTVQKKALAIIEGYINSNKESWCETASKQTLLITKEKLAGLHEKIEVLVRECNDVMHTLSSS